MLTASDIWSEHPFRRPVEVESREWLALVETEASLWTDERRMEITMLCDATVTLTQGTTIQTLYPPGNDAFSCDEPHFSVQWAGDLDGDGRLDLVTT